MIIPNVGHVPHLQVPDIFNRELLKFLQAESTINQSQVRTEHEWPSQYPAA